MQLVDLSDLDIFDYIILGCYAAIAVLGVVQIATRRVMGSYMGRFTLKSLKVYAVLSGVCYLLGGGGAVLCTLMRDVDDFWACIVLAGGFLLAVAAHFAVLKKR